VKHTHPHPDATSPPDLNELSVPLRRAVEHVRKEPVPEEVMQRTLDRVQQLAPIPLPRAYRQRQRAILALAAMAAMLLIAVLVVTNRTNDAAFPRLFVQVDDTLRIQDGTSNTVQRHDGELKLHGLADPDVVQMDSLGGGGGDPRADGEGSGEGKGSGYGKFDPNRFITGLTPGGPKPTAPPPGGLGLGGGLGVGGGAFGAAGGGFPGTGSNPYGNGKQPDGDGYFRRTTEEDEKSIYLTSKNGQMTVEEIKRLEETIRANSDRGANFTTKPSEGKPVPDKPGLKEITELEEKGQPPKSETSRGGEKDKGKEDKDKKPADGKQTDSEKKKASEKPKVWKRSAGRPTFARVYVGEGNSLELVSLQVTVTVEGPRARTVVDHIFRNPHNQQLEGTFDYPLPAGASPSYFAMFLGQTRETPPPRFNAKGDPIALPQEAGSSITPAEVAKHVSAADWGTLREAHVVSRDKGLETYENIVRTRIDPALLEYAGGNTFSGRVFPIPAKGLNRVLIAYEETLPVSADRAVYRYPLPDCDLTELEFRLQAGAAECKDAKVSPKEVTKAESEGLTYSHSWKKTGPGGEVAFSFTPAQPVVQAISGRQSENGPLYAYARVRPELKVEKAEAFASHAVFLLDTSLSEHPDRFDRNMKLLKKILESDTAIKQFNVLTFNVGAAWLQPKGWLDNTDKGREQVFKRLDGLLLEGATDFGCALNKLAKPGFDVQAGTPLNVFVLSDGQITWGEREVNPLVARFEERSPFTSRFHCYRTGLGADNLELFGALAHRGGGVYNCYNDADLPAAALAHRSECLRVENVHFSGGPAAGDVLIAGRKGAVYPGGELIVGAKMAKAGKTTLVVEGTFLGKPWSEEYPIVLDGYSDLAPRGWGEIAVASLLALNDAKYDGLVTAYSQQFSIGSRVASFLVLENDADYKRFNLEDERGKTVSGDMGTYLDNAWKSMAKALSARDTFMNFLGKVEPRVKVLGGEQKDYVKKLLDLLKDADFELPETTLEGKLVAKADVPAGYLTKRAADVRDANVYLMEARRRSDSDDPAGAVRALSSLIELYPARGDALRLVGYRLLDMKQPAQAANLFRQVQEQRPFEPHSYRDLARSLEESGKYGLAALQYEIVLAGTWHNRFHESIKWVAREEYAHMMREAIAQKAVSSELANHFGDRLEKMDPKQFQSDLRVTISWNTDNTDVDLWVIEPDNTKCFYSHRTTANGGELTEDMTQGYGPERYQAKTAMKGKYRVLVHYFRPNPNLLAGETHVNVVVTRFAGTPREVVERHTVILKKHNEEAHVCEVEFK
jgi:tetratricopeptide (TPR) repeat protein